MQTSVEILEYILSLNRVECKDGSKEKDLSLSAYARTPSSSGLPYSERSSSWSSHLLQKPVTKGPHSLHDIPTQSPLLQQSKSPHISQKHATQSLFPAVQFSISFSESQLQLSQSIPRHVSQIDVSPQSKQNHLSHPSHIAVASGRSHSNTICHNHGTALQQRRTRGNSVHDTANRSACRIHRTRL